MPLVFGEGDPKNPSIEPGVETDCTRGKLAAEDEPAISPATAAVAGEIAKLTVSAAEDREDLLPEDDRWMWCDGECDIEFSDWSQGHWYFCVQCANCDLNEECYQVSEASFSETQGNLTFF